MLYRGFQSVTLASGGLSTTLVEKSSKNCIFLINCELLSDLPKHEKNPSAIIVRNCWEYYDYTNNPLSSRLKFYDTYGYQHTH